MNRAQSNEPDQLVSSTVSITVLSVTPARAKKLFAFASVEIDIDGVQIGVHGIRVMREDGGTAIELPKFRDTGGAGRAAITLPQEVHSPIAKAVFDELVERGPGRQTARRDDCRLPQPGLMNVSTKYRCHRLHRSHPSDGSKGWLRVP